jgi:hypothetical protein
VRPSTRNVAQPVARRKCKSLDGGILHRANGKCDPSLLRDVRRTCERAKVPDDINFPGTAQSGSGVAGAASSLSTRDNKSQSASSLRALPSGLLASSRFPCFAAAMAGELDGVLGSGKCGNARLWHPRQQKDLQDNGAAVLKASQNDAPGSRAARAAERAAARTGSGRRAGVWRQLNTCCSAPRRVSSRSP